MMVQMTSRDRVQAAFAHREPDRVPIDIAATGASLIRREVYDGVWAIWGLPEEPDLGSEHHLGHGQPRRGLPATHRR